MFRPALLHRVVVGLAAGFVLSPDAVHAADSLATPVTGQSADALWPLEVQLSIVPLRRARDGDPTPSAVPMPTRAVVVPDGHRLTFSSVIPTAKGRRQFSMAVVARHHPDDAVEIEWDLEVSDARYRPVSWGGYLLHRLQLGPKPQLGPVGLRLARADIVSVRGAPHREVVDIDGEAYEIRIVARSLRG